MRMLQKKPNDRFSDMRALIESFEAALVKVRSGQAPGRKTSVEGLARSTAPPASSTATTDKVDEVPRNKAPIYVAVAVSAAALVVLVGVAVTRLGGKPAPKTAAAMTPATTRRRGAATVRRRRGPTIAGSPLARRRRPSVQPRSHRAAGRRGAARRRVVALAASTSVTARQSAGARDSSPGFQDDRRRSRSTTTRRSRLSCGQARPVTARCAPRSKPRRRQQPPLPRRSITSPTCEYLRVAASLLHRYLPSLGRRA